MHDDVMLADILVQLLQRDRTSEMQISAAKVLTYMCGGGALSPSDTKISMKVGYMSVCEFAQINYFRFVKSYY